MIIAGHGKLLLGDGGYYEGTFVHGEIEGHGYRVFGLTKATYSGQFHRGEMHGQGILSYPGGEQYEGSWVEGRKEGMMQQIAATLLNTCMYAKVLSCCSSTKQMHWVWINLHYCPFDPFVKGGI